MTRFLLSMAVCLTAFNMAIANDIGAVDRGAVVYIENCVACHQPVGEGIEPVFPALANSEFVSGEAADVAGVISNGRAAMPAFQQDLSLEEIAAVTTYIRQVWGNHGSAVDVAMVERATVRNIIDETARARDDDF